jgi:GNAT superfamily N-acetyltransferase
MIKLFDLLNESIKIKTTKEDEDRIKISIPEVGFVTLVSTFPEYEFLDDLPASEIEDFENEFGISEGDLIGKIEHIDIDPNKRGQGYAKILMKAAIQKAEKLGWTPIYLNASPMGYNGLNIEDLTNFYSKFGFKTFKSQGGNNLMIRK